MRPIDGRNPLRWDCAERGCFNRLRRPKLEVFAGCFPGRINFGDVDGLVEVSGNLLIIEWKGVARPLPRGQHILYERLTTLAPATVLVLVGDAEDMRITEWAMVWRGKLSRYHPTTLESVQRLCSQWSDWAIKHPRV